MIFSKLRNDLCVFSFVLLSLKLFESQSRSSHSILGGRSGCAHSAQACLFQDTPLVEVFLGWGGGGSHVVGACLIM